MKGPGIYLAQFMGDEPPVNNLENICRYMAGLGYVGVQLPSWDGRCINLQKLAESNVYVDEIKGVVESTGMQISELGTHLQGQLIAVHQAYDTLFDGFAPQKYHNNPKARTEWAANQMIYAARASKNLGLKAVVTFSGAFLWPYMYPWPQRPKGLVETGFRELARRWLPILKIYDECDVDLCFEIHPGEDLHDGVTFERFLEATGNHPRVKMLFDPSHFVLQQLDYLGHIDLYHEYIKMFHVKDAEYNPTARSGVYGGYQDWIDRPGRFRSLGDGQVDFKGIFSKLAQYGYEGWAVVEWECALKNPEDGAREGAEFVKHHMIKRSSKSFDDFASSGADDKANTKILGIN
jgi:sugar phosphate isomerase/epimerase